MSLRNFTCYSIYSAGSSSAFTVSPGTITLEPEDTTATVNITLVDDIFPEDDLNETVTASSSGAIKTFTITIKDNDCKLNSLVVH